MEELGRIGEKGDKGKWRRVGDDSEEKWGRWRIDRRVRGEMEEREK